MTSPLLLIAMILTVLIGKYLANRNEQGKFFIGAKEVTLNQQYMALALVSIPVYLWAGVKDLVFWVLGKIPHFYFNLIYFSIIYFK